MALLFMIIFFAQNPLGKAASNFQKGNYQESIKYCDEVLKDRPDNYKALLYRGESFLMMGEYGEALKCFEKASINNGDDPELLTNMGYTYYYLEDYSKAATCFYNVMELYPRGTEAYVWNAFSFIGMGKYDDALILCSRALNIDDQCSDAYDARGLALFHKTMYRDAIKSLDKAIELSPGYEDAYLNKIMTLFSQRDYSSCIETSTKAQKLFPDNADIPGYMGDCYSRLGNHELAIEQYEKMLELSEDNEYAAAALGWEYFAMQDYEKTAMYRNLVLKANSQSEQGFQLSQALKMAEQPVNQQIIQFVRDNYLYYDKVDSFEEKAARFLKKSTVDSQAVAEFINSIKLKDDMFTFVVSGDEYEQMLKYDEESGMQYTEFKPDVHVIQIWSFTPSTDSEFIKIINGIKNPENDTLIIDLRNNGGGFAQSSSSILDYFVPKCTTCNFVYRDGNTYSMYSDEDDVKFKNIYIFVNELSASSSELLALGLRSKLDNVKIVGKPTFGKGVGQVTYEDKKGKFVVFLVNTSWNVDGINIMGKGIKPDITVKGTKNEDYLDSIGLNEQ
jgi:tetratricopeptide (TPR) repeat protein